MLYHVVLSSYAWMGGGDPSDYFVSNHLQLWLFCCWGCGCCWLGCDNWGHFEMSPQFALIQKGNFSVTSIFVGGGVNFHSSKYLNKQQNLPMI